MLENYNKVSMAFDELENIKVINNEPFLLEVMDNNIKYEFFIRINRKAEKLLVFGSK